MEVQGAMRFLVTGGAGYIGSNLVDSLIMDGHEVIVIDNFTTGKRENIDHLMGNPGFRFYQDDILNEDLLEKVAGEVDGIYHLAAAVGVQNIVNKPLEGMTTNVEGSHNVIRAASKHGVKILIASSSEVYGLSDKIPMSENDKRVLGPTEVYRWSYSLSKALDEHLLYAYQKERNLKFSVVRYFNSYGPRMDMTGESGYSSVVAKFISLALKGESLTIHDSGDQTRSFTYIDDTVNGTRLAFEKPKGEGQVFNIGNNVEISINQLADIIEEVTGIKVGRVHLKSKEVYGRHYEDIPKRQPDIKKAKETLGFEAKTDIREGLRKTVDWAKKLV
jgi:UDP-glucose 4-epimerase